jgi:hypothetical protein
VQEDFVVNEVILSTTDPAALDVFIGRYGAEILFRAELLDDPGNLPPDKLRSAEYSTADDYLLCVNLDTIDTCVGCLSHPRDLVERALFQSR